MLHNRRIRRLQPLHVLVRLLLLHLLHVLQPFSQGQRQWQVIFGALIRVYDFCPIIYLPFLYHLPQLLRYLWNLRLLILYRLSLHLMVLTDRSS